MKVDRFHEKKKTKTNSKFTRRHSSLSFVWEKVRFDSVFHFEIRHFPSDEILVESKDPEQNQRIQIDDRFHLSIKTMDKFP